MQETQLEQAIILRIQVEMRIQVMMRIQVTIPQAPAVMYPEADVKIVPEMMQDPPEIPLRMMQALLEILPEILPVTQVETIS